MDSSSVLLQQPKTDIWGTPRWLFEALDREFRFTLDPCATAGNAKCKRYFTQADNGLTRDWGRETVFMNPPYSLAKAWVRKAYGSAQEGATVVCLVPSRTDTDWWHNYAMKGEIRFLRGQLYFNDGEGRAPFPSAIVIFRPPQFVLKTFELSSRNEHG